MGLEEGSYGWSAMVASWVVDEMRGVDLEDKRLDARLKEVLSQLGSRPTASIPAACGGHAEMTAAYRLFDNEKATWSALLQPHGAATRKRVAREAVVVVAQDTTEVDMTRPEQPVVGAGPLAGPSRRGAFLHLLHGFTPDGTPLGTLDSMAWTRDEEVGCALMTRGERAGTPIEKKESFRWVDMLRRAQAEAVHCPATQLVCVADSEADIYELLVEGMAEPRRVDWIVRACQDRALRAGNGKEKSEAAYVRAHVLEQVVLFTQAIRVRGRKTKIACKTNRRNQPRESRDAQVEVRAARATLRPPWRRDRKLPEVTVNVVLVREVDPPGDDEPVEWLLLTSLPIEGVEQVRQVIQYYCVRWMIEVLFRTLKSGCRVEDRRFEHIDRMLSCLAVYLIVAWRTLYVCRLGRSCPEISAEAVFEPAEWKSAWKIIHRTPPPRQPPPLETMVRLIARLGGYVDRKGSGPPGPQTLWIGLQRMHDFALCWELFGPDSRAGPKLV